MIRSDNYISVVLKLQNGTDIEISKKDSIDLMSYTFLYNDIPIMYNIGYINITEECDIKDIIVKYNNIKIDTISVNTKYYKKDVINISKYLKNKESSYNIIKK